MNKKGIALAFALIIILILIVMVLSVALIGVMNLRTMSGYRDSVMAYYAARAGIGRAVDELREDSTWTAGFNNVSLGEVEAVYTVSFNQADSNYSTNNLNGINPVLRSDGISVPVAFVYLVSTGTCFGKTRRVAVMAKRQALPGYPFIFPVFGDSWVKIDGSGGTNSYNSDNDPYPYTLLYTGGDIATNSTSTVSPYAVEISNTGNMYGTVFVGYGGDPASAIHKNGSGSYSGGSSLPSEITLYTITDPVYGASQGDAVYTSSGDLGVLPPGKYENFELSSSGRIKLTSGNYSFSSFTHTGSGTVDIDASNGPVNIYVNGSINFTGSGFANPTYLAENLRFWGTSSCTSVTLVGSAQGYYVCYAPSADIAIRGTFDLYGAVVGKTVTLGGTGKVVYDQALRDLAVTSSGGGSGLLDIVTWQNVY